MSTLLVASTGGHLKQLHTLRPRLRDLPEPFVWVTFDTPQSRSLLSGETVEFVRFVGGRDPVNVLRNVPSARRILKKHGVTTMVSTGSAVALPFFGLGRMRRLTCHYIESAARSDGPSASAKMIARIPGVHLYSQYRGWAQGRWGYAGSVFDAFERDADEASSSQELRRVVVTLGTYRGFGFPAILERLPGLLPADAEVLWQTGDTDSQQLGIDGIYAMPESELKDAMESADVVIAHAGVGAALLAFQAGKVPVLVPRRKHRDEHIDDHQTQIAAELARRGLAVSSEVDQLDLEDLLAASRARIKMAENVPALTLVPTE